MSGLAAGHPKLTFTVSRGRNRSDIKAFTVVLPSGLSFNRKAVATRKTCSGSGTKKKCTSSVSVAGVSISGGTLKSAQLGAGSLLVTLKRPVATLSATIGPAALTELASLAARVKRHAVKSLRVIVIVTSASGAHTTVVLTDTNPR
jgi:hypothetical protein